MEWQLGLICACAPSFRVFTRGYLRDGIGKFVRSYGSTGRSGDHRALESDVDSIHLYAQAAAITKTSEVTISTTQKPDVSKSSLEIVGEHASLPVKPSAAYMRQAITTPQEYEMHSLQEIEKGRDSFLHGSTRPRADRDKGVPERPPSFRQPSSLHPEPWPLGSSNPLSEDPEQGVTESPPVTPRWR